MDMTLKQLKSAIRKATTNFQLVSYMEIASKMAQADEITQRQFEAIVKSINARR